MKLSEDFVDRLNEMDVPNTAPVRKMLAPFLSDSRNILSVRDLPNGMKEIEILQPPSHKDNGTEPNTTGNQEP